MFGFLANTLQRFLVLPTGLNYSNVPWTFLHYFLNEGGKYMYKRRIWTICWVFMEILFKVPKPRYPRDANSRQRDKESLNSSTQAKPSQRGGLRSSLRSSTGKVQECSLTQWLHNPTSCTCAALQWQRSSTEEQWAAAAATGRLRSISLVCRLHNTVTLHLTAVRLAVRFRSRQGQLSIHAHSPEVSRSSKVS